MFPLRSASFVCLMLLPLLALSACTVTKSTKPNKRYDVNWHVGESLLDYIFGPSESEFERELRESKVRDSKWRKDNNALPPAVPG